MEAVQSRCAQVDELTTVRMKALAGRTQTAVQRHNLRGLARNEEGKRSLGRPRTGRTTELRKEHERCEVASFHFFDISNKDTVYHRVHQEDNDGVSIVKKLPVWQI